MGTLQTEQKNVVGFIFSGNEVIRVERQRQKFSLPLVLGSFTVATHKGQSRNKRLTKIKNETACIYLEMCKQ